MYCWFEIFELQLELVCTQGDSGGPLTVEENGKHFQVGIVSGSGSCAKVDIY